MLQIIKIHQFIHAWATSSVPARHPADVYERANFWPTPSPLPNSWEVHYSNTNWFICWCTPAAAATNIDTAKTQKGAICTQITHAAQCWWLAPAPNGRYGKIFNQKLMNHDETHLSFSCAQNFSQLFIIIAHIFRFCWWCWLAALVCTRSVITLCHRTCPKPGLNATTRPPHTVATQFIK